MAIFFNRNKKSEAVEKPSEGVSWATATMCLSVGVFVGFGITPAYAGMCAASLVPSC